MKEDEICLQCNQYYYCEKDEKHINLCKEFTKRKEKQE